MQYSNLGNTDLKVSKICLGTMTFGEQNTESDAHEQLSYALEQGVNFIDTAEMYAVPGRKETQGLTEKYIGTWLKNRSDRDNLVVATKVAGPSAGITYLRNPLRFDRDQIYEALNNSLRRLQTDYVDLYQLHWPERNTNCFGKLDYKHDPNDPWKDNLLEVLLVLDDLVHEGKIRYYGVSNETPWGLMRFLHLSEQYGLTRCVSIQNPYSLLNRSFEVGLSEIAMREQVGLLSYSPMGFGLLSGKYHKGIQGEKARLSLFPRMARYSGELSHEATTKYLQIADKYGLRPAQMALSFVNSRPFLTSNIIGATTMAQLKENIGSIQVELSEEVLQEIDAVHRQIPNPAP